MTVADCAAAPTFSELRSYLAAVRMITIICLTRKPARESADWRRRGFPLVCAAAACCGVLAGAKGAELVDSGWAIATPTPITSKAAPADPTHQMVLRHVLDQTQQPLLIHRSPSQLPSSQPEQNQSGVRFAVRPDGIDGWRPVGQPYAPLAEPISGPVSAPQFVLP